MATLPRICFSRLPSALARPSTKQHTIRAIRAASTIHNDPAVTDPNMNGGYINPPPGKRALRDPYGDWWDKQERRNFGEPIHEDNDIFAVFSPEPYTHAPPGKAAFHFACFVATVLGLCGAVYQFYPDRPSAPRVFDDGLYNELGGEGARHARSSKEDL